MKSSEVGTFNLHLGACHTCINYIPTYDDCSFVFSEKEIFKLDFSNNTLYCIEYTDYQEEESK